MAAVALHQTVSFQPFEVSQGVRDKELSTPVSALGRNDPVTACQPTDLKTPSSPTSSLIESNKDQDPGDLKDLKMRPEQDSQPAHNPGESPKSIGIRSSLASVPCSMPDKKSGKVKKKAKAKAKKRNGAKEQGRNKTNQVVQQQVALDPECSTNGIQ